MLLSGGLKLPYYLGNFRYAEHLFDLKSHFSVSEFIELLNLLDIESAHDLKANNSAMKDFEYLVQENIDYLIETVSQAKMVPLCLAVSVVFRDECIKRRRIDLAVKCNLP